MKTAKTIYLPMQNKIRTRFTISKDGIKVQQKKFETMFWKPAELTNELLFQIIKACRENFCADCPYTFYGSKNQHPSLKNNPKYDFLKSRMFQCR